MNFEKYTERARGFVQSAQSLAMREGNQQFTPEHLLKVLLDDVQGLAAGLIDKAGGRSRDALVATDLALAKLPKDHPLGLANRSGRKNRRHKRECTGLGGSTGIPLGCPSSAYFT